MSDGIKPLDEALLRAATAYAAAEENYWSNAEESGVAADHDVGARHARKVFLASLAIDGWVLVPKEAAGWRIVPRTMEDER